MRVLVLLAACSAPPKPAPAPVSPPPPRDLAVAEPASRPPPEAPPDPDAWLLDARRPPSVETMVRRSNVPPQELVVAERDLWSPCVRAFVQAQPPAARRVLTAAFARYPTSCDADKQIVIEAPREYRDRFVVFRGPLAAMRLDVVTCGPTPGDAVAIVYDGKRWSATSTSAQLGACTTTSVPDMPSLRRVLRDAVEARDFVVAEVMVTDEMKRDLRLVLDALDVLSAR